MYSLQNECGWAKGEEYRGNLVRRSGGEGAGGEGGQGGEECRGIHGVNRKLLD